MSDFPCGDYPYPQTDRTAEFVAPGGAVNAGHSALQRTARIPTLARRRPIGYPDSFRFTPTETNNGQLRLHDEQGGQNRPAEAPDLERYFALLF
ncbi:MAG: hypothetical protein ACI802_003794, partial [Candidatus Paceibacteria bacterium]